IRKVCFLGDGKFIIEICIPVPLLLVTMLLTLIFPRLSIDEFGSISIAALGLTPSVYKNLQFCTTILSPLLIVIPFLLFFLKITFSITIFEGTAPFLLVISIPSPQNSSIIESSIVILDACFIYIPIPHSPLVSK